MMKRTFCFLLLCFASVNGCISPEDGNDFQYLPGLTGKQLVSKMSELIRSFRQQFPFENTETCETESRNLVLAVAKYVLPKIKGECTESLFRTVFLFNSNNEAEYENLPAYTSEQIQEIYPQERTKPYSNMICHSENIHDHLNLTEGYSLATTGQVLVDMLFDQLEVDPNECSYFRESMDSFDVMDVMIPQISEKSPAEMKLELQRYVNGMNSVKEMVKNEVAELICGGGTTRPQDCAEHFNEGQRQNGVYTIYPGGEAVDVYCDDMQSGGSILIQNRYDGSVDFSKTFEEYSEGFGNLTGEHWLGLSHVHRITATGLWTLRIELESFQNERKHAEYSNFIVGPAPGFQLLFDKSSYSGDAGAPYYGLDGWDLSFHHGCKFSTHDRDQDMWSEGNCAHLYGSGGFWYHGEEYCAYVLTTGMPYTSRAPGSIIWYPWKRLTDLKSVTLRIIKQS